MRLACAIFAALSAPSGILAQEIYPAFPDVIHADERYVIYSHGLIVEGTDPRPAHPEFGAYAFPEIVEALFENGGFNLIAHHRPKDTDVMEYVEQLVAWVNELIAEGVKPSRITLVGFSRGAQLTALAADALRDRGVNTAIMALCSNGDYAAHKTLELGGHVLSIYETSDIVTSCERLLIRSESASTHEIAISTGERHGAFYRPREEWVLPLRRWIDETNR